MANIADVVLASFQSSAMSPAILRDIAERAGGITSQPDYPALSAALELHQRNAGFAPVLSAAEMRLLALYSQQNAHLALLRQGQIELSDAQRRLAAGLSANRQLVELDPSAGACLHWKRGELLALSNRRSEAVAAYRSSVRAASEHKCECGRISAHIQGCIPFCHLTTDPPPPAAHVTGCSPLGRDGGSPSPG